MGPRAMNETGSDRLEIRWRCGAGVGLVGRPDSSLQLIMPDRASVAIGLPPSLGRIAARLNEGLSDRDIAVAAGTDVGLMARVFALVNRFRNHGLLVADLFLEGRLLATIRPLVPDFSLEDTQTSDADGPWRLSRFALLRADGSKWVLESSEASCDVVLRDAAILSWLHDAEAPQTEPGRLQFLQCLARLGFLESADAAEEPSRQTWEFHDRLFHNHSRALGGLRPFGRTYRFRDRGDEVPPLPALPPPYTGASVELPVPEPGAHGSLADVMERRRSGRHMGAPPVSLAQVATLLYRVARITDTQPAGLIRRSYPSGGALHELEFYLAVRECAGLEGGFYHYRGEAHLLTRLPGAEADTAAALMIDDCASLWMQPDEPPQCLVVISSRFPRISWNYQGVAYRISLMNAGVALQSLCLVATDLGLNGCIAGAGKSALFARATGRSSWAETSIAEFGFGSRRPS